MTAANSSDRSLQLCGRGAVPAMVTGVWGKKISEGTTPVGAPMAFASVIIFGATFLGLRLKLQMMRQMFDVFLDYHAQNVAMGRQAQQAMRNRHAGPGSRSEPRSRASESDEVRLLPTR